jgi:diguanylate cyclase (GGDEF)-like protein
MSDLVFYAEVCVGCVCVLLILLYSIKKLPTPQLKFSLFYKLVAWHIIYFVSDAIWALVNDGLIAKNVFSVLAINYTNAVIISILFYSCFVFAEISTRPEMTRAQIQSLQTKLRVPIIIETVLLLVLFVVAPSFWLNQDLEPIDLYYLISLFLPFVYLVTPTVRCLARAFKPQNRKNLKTYLIVASYVPCCILAAALQLFYSQNVPIFCFGCTLIILFVYLNLQNQLISTDTLTSLNNRNQLERFLQHQRDPKDYYVFMVDVDHFKQINDSYGHVEGDKALITVSKALKKACDCLGKSAFLCRYGGDEFLLVMQTGMPGYVVLVIRECLQDEILNRQKTLNYALEVSVGYASWDGQSSNFRESVVKADQMMYDNKRAS